MSRVLAVPDLHHPFCHKHALEFVLDVKARFKCDTVVQLGDELDMAALSRYDSDPDGMSAGDELKAAKVSLKPWFKAIPKLKLVESNHTIRPFKKAFSAGIPKAYLKSYSEFLDAPSGWSWEPRLFIDGVM
jgi:hypothetical protein